MTLKGAQNHAHLTPDETPSRYDMLIGRMRADEEPAQSGAGMERDICTAVECPIVKGMDGGQVLPEEGDGAVEVDEVGADQFE